MTPNFAFEQESMSWEDVAGSIIDTVNLTNEDDVNEATADQLKKYFGKSWETIQGLRKSLRRAQAYREWLRDGFRDIAKGTASPEAKGDNYVQYAWDALSGPTEEMLQEIIDRRALAQEAGK